MRPADSVVLKKGEGERFWTLGDHVTQKVGAAATGGAFCLAEIIAFPGGGPPPHIHHREDEMFYVLEGSWRFLLGDAVTPVVGPGHAIYLPKGIIHQFQNVGTTRGRFLAFAAPCGFEAFIRDISQPAQESDPTTPCPPAQESVDRCMSLAPAYGIEMRPEFRAGALLAPRPPRSKWVLGERITFKLTSAETGGRFCMVEVSSSPGGGPPPHTHVREDELFYVLEGEYEFGIGDRCERLGPGSTIFVPRGICHTYKNVGWGPGRLLDLHTPGGFEAFFEEAGIEAVNGCCDRPPDVRMEPARILSIIRRHGMEVAGV
jgi:quercetin dioxygenase-like cupin family protein